MIYLSWLINERIRAIYYVIQIISNIKLIKMNYIILNSLSYIFTILIPFFILRAFLKL